MNYLIIGAGGFLGYSLASYFQLNKINFSTISRSFQWSQMSFETRYICNASMIKDIFDFLGDDITILYMAGSPNLLLAEHDPFGNITHHLDEFSSFVKGIIDARFNSKRIIFFSSAGTVYGDSCGIPKTEKDILSPKSYYGTRNVMLETLVLTSSISHDIISSIFRVSNPFGPGQSQFKRRGLIQVLIDSSVSGETVFIRGNGNQVRDYIYSTDLARMIGSLLKLKQLPSIINIASGFSYSAKEVINLLNEASIFPCVEYIDDSKSYEVCDSLISSDYAKQLTGMSDNELEPLTQSKIVKVIDEQYKL